MRRRAEAGEARCACPKRSRSSTFETSPPEARRARGYGPSTTPGPLPATSGSPKSVASRPFGARIRASSASSKRRAGHLGADVRRQPVAGVRVRPGLFDREEAAHRRQFRDDAGQRVVAVAEPAQVTALAVVPARVRKQVPNAHVGRPDAGRGLDIEQAERERRRERLGHGSDPEPRRRVAADPDRLDVLADRRPDCQRRNIPGHRRGLTNRVKRRIAASIRYPNQRPGLGRARPSFAACGGPG